MWDTPKQLRVKVSPFCSGARGNRNGELAERHAKARCQSARFQIDQRVTHRNTLTPVSCTHISRQCGGRSSPGHSWCRQMQCLKHVLNSRCRGSVQFYTITCRSYHLNLSMSEKEDAPVCDHVEKAWAHWNKLGAPKYSVAPMVDQVMQDSPNNTTYTLVLFRMHYVLLLHLLDVI